MSYLCIYRYMYHVYISIYVYHKYIYIHTLITFGKSLKNP